MTTDIPNTTEPLALKLNEGLGHMVTKRAERCTPRADAVPGMRGLC